MKKQLIRVGFYKELKHGRTDGESLKAAFQPTAGTDDAKLVEYLKAGKTMMIAAGPVRDVLANGIIGTLAILTDGDYAGRLTSRTTSSATTRECLPNSWSTRAHMDS